MKTKTMKYMLSLAAALTLGGSFAAPFVWPAKWSADAPSAAKKGGEYRDTNLSDFKTVNPFTTTELGNIPSIMSSNGGLFRQDPTNDEFIPYMADALPTVSNSGKRFVVKIRQGMKFSDGQPITADDWVTTFKIHTDDKVGSNSYDSFFINDKPVTVKKLDTYTLQFDFPSSVATAYVVMSYTPWPDHVFGVAYKAGGAEAVKKLWGLNVDPKAVVSPGPFVLSAYSAGQRATFKKNTYFGDWNKDSAGAALPYLDGESVRIVKDLNADLAAYLAGETDAFAPSKADDLAQIKKAIDGGSIKATLLPNISPAAASQWIVWNWNKSADPYKQSLFRDVRFRKAMSMIANREAMVQLALGGLGVPTYYSVYPVFKNYIADSAPKYPYNLDMASKLFTQMGYKKGGDGVLVNSKGQKIEFTLATNSGNTVREQLARIFVDEAKKVGVKVNYAPIDFNVLVGQLTAKGANRPFDAILLGLGGGDNIWPFGANVVPCGTNLHSYNVPDDGKCATAQEQLMTKLFYQGQATVDSAARRQIGAKLLTTEATLQPVLYLVGGTYHVTYNNRVGGQYPKNLMDAYYGSRNIETTFIK
jgi:peptide/nickel transport system substrate-binding protein